MRLVVVSWPAWQEDSLCTSSSASSVSAVGLALDQPRQRVNVRIAGTGAAVGNETVEPDLHIAHGVVAAPHLLVVSVGSSAPSTASDQSRRGPRWSDGTPGACCR